MFIKPARFLIVGFLCCLPAGFLYAESVKIVGSSIVAPPVLEAMNALKKQQDLDVEVSSVGGVSAGLSSLGESGARIAMMARHLQPEDRAGLPDLKLTEIRVGQQVAALCVSADVWNSGIRGLGAGQIRGIYEGRIKNWKELGGGDQKISFFNWEEGHGMWELLADWLYQSANRAPKGKFTPIASNVEARNAIEFTAGAIALMSPKLVREGVVCPIALNQPNGPVQPSPENVASGLYPLIRPLVLVIDDKPTGTVKVAIEFILGPQGQQCFGKLGFFTATELEANVHPDSQAK